LPSDFCFAPGEPALIFPAMKISTHCQLALLLAGLLLTNGCLHKRSAHHQPTTDWTVATTIGAEIIAAEAPPPPVAEIITVSPDPHFVWVGGGWIWRGHWVWERGHWEQPPRPAAVWVPHHYVYRGGNHIYVRGGWR
jgi:hypothetical protein